MERILEENNELETVLSVDIVVVEREDDCRKDGWLNSANAAS